MLATLSFYAHGLFYYPVPAVLTKVFVHRVR